LALHHHSLAVTASVGVAKSKGRGSATDLIRDADVAMYASKAAGKNCVRIFDEEMRRGVVRRHEVEQAMRAGLPRGEFRAVFQPKVTADECNLVGFEALARWRSPALGDVSPSEFIPIAEEAGLVADLGESILHDACIFLAEMGAHTERKLTIAVNVSVEQLVDPDRLVAAVKKTIQASGIWPSQLELEITESLLVKRPDVAVATLRTLKTIGVQLSIDDFGTGYSSLAYLKKFPIDSLKVDRAFVSELVESRETRAIVSAILSLARALNLKTVGEGIESSEELAILRQMGCDDIQGYVIARPLERADALDFDTSWSESGSGEFLAHASGDVRTLLK
jgi:EAL domain-containing protein (putative c-di-GMP-specific phosphodiesterase class I)